MNNVADDPWKRTQQIRDKRAPSRGTCYAGSKRLGAQTLGSSRNHENGQSSLWRD